MVCKSHSRRRYSHVSSRGEKQNNRRYPSPYAQHHQHRNPLIGRVLNHGYEVIGFIGQGTSAKVVTAVDIRTDNTVVIKIQKREDYHYVMREIDILESIARSHEGRGSAHVVRLLDWFEEKSVGICLVFEKGMYSLWECMERKQGAFCLSDIQEFGRQLLTAVQHFHKLGITHADFKPENLVFFPKHSHEPCLNIPTILP